eukprot:TRINITY_DN16539_c0_g1_i1.p1 TRINITY_DN16539_c0_g1~~TRINITY_DN16539_c0_g1_i1.p1  ORF type:complete len:497 (+),score=151.24 TRINITY_DN16539_c0_g1_i1:119-1492(+)
MTVRAPAVRPRTPTPPPMQQGVPEVWRLLDLPDDALEHVAGFLCHPAVPGVPHDLTTWRQVCRGFRAVDGAYLWQQAWEATCQESILHAGKQFADQWGTQSAADRARVIKTFRAEAESFTAEAALELGLLPHTLPPWCRTAADVERALLGAVSFCCFQVTTAREELQSARGSIPVIESFAVVASIAHSVAGGIAYLRSDDRELSRLTVPMYRIFGAWLLFLVAYAAYRIQLKRIKRIPEKAMKMWHLSCPPSQGFGVRYLLYDQRFVGAACWTACLWLSLHFWQSEIALRRELTPERLLYVVFLPPTFAATLVAWQRSGQRIGLRAGALVGGTLVCVTYCPSVLFLALGVWAATVLLNQHTGYYHPPRAHIPPCLRPVATLLGNVVIYAVLALSVAWVFCSLDVFLYVLVAALAVLALWVGVAVFTPLFFRCYTMNVTPPVFYVSGQALLSIGSYFL